MRRALPVLVAFLAGAVLTLVLVDRLLRFDSQAVATGITIAATIATTLATVALAWFGWVQIQAARRQQRGVAGALLEEVHRIRTELGVPPSEGETPLIVDSHTGGVPPYGAAIVTDAVPPEIHPWFHRVIPQVAESDATVVGLFLKLDRELYNYSDGIERLAAAQRSLSECRDALRRWLQANPNAVQMDAVMVRQQAEREVALAEANLDAATHTAVTRYRTCHDTLRNLTRDLLALRPQARRPRGP